MSTATQRMRTSMLAGVVAVGMTVGLAVPEAQALPADLPIVGPLLPQPFQRYTAFDDITQVFTNPEGGQVRHTLRKSGFSNNSALFDQQRYAGVTMDVNNRVSRSYKKAFYIAGVEFGCQMGLGSAKVTVEYTSNTSIKVNGESSVSGRTEPLTDFMQQTAKTAANLAIAASECGASEGTACPALASAIADNAAPQIVTTWNLQDTVSTATNHEGKFSANPKTKAKYRLTIQPGQMTVLPLFILRYSPGQNHVRFSNVGIRSTGCVGISALRPFITTIGLTRSGNYVNYSSYGRPFIFLPNKLFRMDQ